MNEDRNELASFPREAAPPRDLEDAIAAELRRARLLRRSRATLYAIAAALLLLVAGAAFFRMHREAPVQANYVLLLYESPQFTGGSHDEYAAWARQMQPLIVGGEELADGTVLAMNGASTRVPQTTEHLAGYFLIDAKDDAAAARVARACPHLRHGGAIVLRRIVL